MRLKTFCNGGMIVEHEWHTDVFKGSESFKADPVRSPKNTALKAPKTSPPWSTVQGRIRKLTYSGFFTRLLVFLMRIGSS